MCSILALLGQKVCPLFGVSRRRRRDDAAAAEDDDDEDEDDDGRDDDDDENEKHPQTWLRRNLLSLVGREKAALFIIRIVSGHVEDGSDRLFS